jgi:hypothetical protein
MSSPGTRLHPTTHWTRPTWLEERGSVLLEGPGPIQRLGGLPFTVATAGPPFRWFLIRDLQGHRGRRAFILSVALPEAQKVKPTRKSTALLLGQPGPSIQGSSELNLL